MKVEQCEPALCATLTGVLEWFLRGVARDADRGVLFDGSKCGAFECEVHSRSGSKTPG